MYERFYGLSERPFSMVPDAGYLYLGGNHRVAISVLRYALENRVGITLLTGEIGAGKTTLIRQLLAEVGDQVVFGLISNTHQAFGSLMEWVMTAFGLQTTAQSKAELYERFTQYLINEFANGRRAILIVDEAQNLDVSSLEELRLLTNINTDKDELLQLIISGQPELRDKLSDPRLTQFVQRIAVDYHLNALDREQTEQYIVHRLETAGGTKGIFEPDALHFIYLQCAGVPRLINGVCELALVYGYADGRERITADMVYEMIIERLSAGLFGAGKVDYCLAEEERMGAARKKAISRAKRKALLFLKRSRQSSPV